MKSIAATVGILIVILGIMIAAPVFGLIIGIAVAAVFIYAVINDHSETLKNREQDNDQT